MQLLIVPTLVLLNLFFWGGLYNRFGKLFRYLTNPTVTEYLPMSYSKAKAKAMTCKAKAKAITHKAKDLICHAALKPQTLYTVQC